jgi:D-aminopeptidase
VRSDVGPSPAGGRRRARELGLDLGPYPPGPHNAITDVAGIRVGQVSVLEGDDIRTGVTAIVPYAVDRAGGSLAAGLFAGNGFGKLTGATQIAELGVIETPILLTSTLSAFRVADALVSYVLGLPGNERLITVNPVVGETNDGYLSDIRARPVTEQHVLTALRGAASGPVAEGAAGAGTGTSALGFKAGIGTASRTVTLDDGAPAVVGVLVQANFSGVLTVRGVRVDVPDEMPAPDAGDGNSCMIVVATDRDLGSRQLTRVARRAVFAMGRTGADFAHGSGDYAIAFATGALAAVADAALDPVFAAVQDATEEAILNSVFMATTTTGYLGRVRYAVPLDLVTSACRAAGLLAG